METERIHRATSDDGTVIAGRVYGEGPPLVLLHGAMADGLIEWGELVPHLTDRFTCYLPDMRNRGLSGQHPDVSRAARLRDAVAYVESIDQPVAVLGASGGGMLALGVTARSDRIVATAAHEPVVFEAMDPTARGEYGELIDEVTGLAERGDHLRVAEIFFDWVANDDEMAAFGDDAAALEDVARYVPMDVAEFQEAFRGEGESPTAPELLATIDVPVLTLTGTQTGHPWFTASVRFAAEHIPTATVRELDGLGHLAHMFDPEQVATEVVGFLERAVAPAEDRLGRRLVAPSGHPSSLAGLWQGLGTRITS